MNLCAVLEANGCMLNANLLNYLTFFYNIRNFFSFKLGIYCNFCIPLHSWFVSYQEIVCFAKQFLISNSRSYY